MDTMKAAHGGASTMHRSATPESQPPPARFEAVMSVLAPDGTADPSRAPSLSVEQKRGLYRAMVRTRMVDRALERLQRQGRVGFHVGSHGEEAAIVAATAALRDRDFIVPCYRELGALLYRGFPLKTALDNMLGNADDLCHGRQMPDHYASRKYRYLSVSAPIGTHLPHAVGLAWAARKKGRDEVAAVFFGDGATSSEGFHASMNFAAVMNAPVVFLLRNNRWAISTPIEKQTRCENLADKAVAYGMPSVRCDGNDALAVYATVAEAVRRAAAGEGPTLVELLTYRTGAHSTSDDPRAYRSEDEVEHFRSECPVARLRSHLEKLGAWDVETEATLAAEVEAEIRAAVAEAEAVARPSPATLFEGVFREQPWHLREQEAEHARSPRPAGAHEE